VHKKQKLAQKKLLVLYQYLRSKNAYWAKNKKQEECLFQKLKTLYQIPDESI
jgi:hypothetical protein